MEALSDTLEPALNIHPNYYTSPMQIVTLFDDLE